MMFRLLIVFVFIIFISCTASISEQEMNQAIMESGSLTKAEAVEQLNQILHDDGGGFKHKPLGQKDWMHATCDIDKITNYDIYLSCRYVGEDLKAPRHNFNIPISCPEFERELGLNLIEFNYYALNYLGETRFRIASMNKSEAIKIYTHFTKLCD